MERLVVEFGLGEGNGEFVPVRSLALVLGYVAGALRSLMLAVLMLLRFAILPFEANCFFKPLGSDLYELIDAFMEGAVVGDLVAQPEGEELAGVGGGDFVVHREVGAELRALAEPEVLRHFEDEDVFENALRLVLGAETIEKRIKFFLRFRGQDDEFSAESPAGVVIAGVRFAIFRLGTGRMLRILSVGGDLRFGGHGDSIINPLSKHFCVNF
ncbi:MAG: hypothetical protein ACRD4O_13235 [Bryobacteraceae bacterium]